MHFPRVRLLWCPSPYTTAELFDELKVCTVLPLSCDHVYSYAATDVFLFATTYEIAAADTH